MVYSRATTSAMADREALPAGFLVFVDMAVDELESVCLTQLSYYWTADLLNVVVEECRGEVVIEVRPDLNFQSL